MQWLLGTEEELRWAGRRAWIAHCSGNLHVEIYIDPGNQSPAEQSRFLVALSGGLGVWLQEKGGWRKIRKAGVSPL